MNDAEQHLMTVFSAALHLGSAAERQAYLDRTCAEDPGLRDRVEALLRARDRAGGFLGGAAGAAETAGHEPPAEAGSAAPPMAGTVIAGRYKLLERIGEGGMGEVWMAEQTEPIRRKVALKMVKPGMDTRAVLARFDQERQALALMDHPNIAKVLDAGETPGGRPYFVMELVKGVPITRHCDDHRLGVRDRLGLFADVCRAVQHAHQKGIIHRDLKPTNVLVAPYDGKPVVQVIDFGVAKATGQALTDKSLFTGLGAVVGTPEYMSPEQAELNNLDIDTRSDVYALGVLLYELLTGTTPLTRLRVKQVALLEVLRVIREEETPRPSARLSSTEEMPSIAAVRGVEPAVLSRLVRGELDWIVMRALEKDRNRRYETANGLALDVQRYLADEPVEACPPSAKYRLRKFARRNKTALAVAGLIVFFIALLGGGGGWVVRDRAARQAGVAHDLELALDRADLFQGEGKRAEALAALDRAELLAGQARADTVRDGRLAALRERLDAEARDREFIARFEDIWLTDASRSDPGKNRFFNPDLFSAIREALGRWGIAIGAGAPARTAARIQGRPKPVQASLVAALDQLLWQGSKEETPTSQWLLAVLSAADSDPWRVQVRRALLRRDGRSLGPLSRAVEVRTQPPSFLLLVADHLFGTMSHDRLELLRKVRHAYPTDLWANQRLANQLMNEGQPSEAVRYYTAALALKPDSPGIYDNRGHALRKAKELDEAFADFSRSVALAPRYMIARNNRGQVLLDKGLVDEAIAEFREAIRLDKQFAAAHLSLGDALRAKGQTEEGIAEIREAIRLQKNYAEAHTDLGNALRESGRDGEAIAEYLEAIRLGQKFGDGCLPQAHNDLANALSDLGNLDGAIREYREAIWLKEDFAEAHNGISGPLLKKGLVDEAIAECRGAIRLRPDYPEAHTNLGASFASAGRWDEAVAQYREAIRLRKDDADLHLSLGDALSRLGLKDEAVFEYRQALRLKPDHAVARQALDSALGVMGKPAGAAVNRGAGAGGQPRPYAPAVAKAVAKQSDAIERNPKDAGAWMDRGQVYMTLREYEKAVSDFSKVIELDPLHASAWKLRGDAYSYGQPGEHAKAVADYSRAIELDPKLSNAWNNRGSQYQRLGELDKAIADYSRAIELGLGPGSVTPPSMSLTPLNNRGLAYERQGQHEKAIADFSRTIELSPENGDWRFRGDAYRALRQYDKALADYSKAIELAPRIWINWSNRGAIYKDLNRFPEAMADYRKALELGPGVAAVHYALARLLATCPEPGLRDFPEAVKLAEKAIRLWPGIGPYWSTLAVAHYRNGDAEAAIVALDTVLRIQNGGNGPDLFLLALAHEKLGHHDEARAWYDKAVAWQGANQPLLETNQALAEDVRRLRIEAEELLQRKTK